MTNEIRSSNDEESSLGWKLFEFRASSFVRRHSSSYQIDLLPFLQCHYRLFPMRFAAEVGATFAFLFSGIIAGVHIHDLFLKKLLDRLLDLNLVSPRSNAEDVLVLFLAQKRCLLRERRGFNDVERLVHLPPFVLSASFAKPPSVTKIFSKASSCSVFTSLALASVIGLALRADL